MIILLRSGWERPSCCSCLSFHQDLPSTVLQLPIYIVLLALLYPIRTCGEGRTRIALRIRDLNPDLPVFRVVISLYRPAGRWYFSWTTNDQSPRPWHSPGGPYLRTSATDEAHRVARVRRSEDPIFLFPGAAICTTQLRTETETLR